MRGRALILLVHTAHPQALEWAGPGFGRLLSPPNCSRARDTGEAGIPWAADNGAFSGWDEREFRLMLKAIQGAPGCLFVTAPDTVADWMETRNRFELWAPVLEEHGLPIAFVAQDDQPPCEVPWDRIAALFIGGTTEYKLSPEAERLGYEAKERELWLHMGRVNSRKRAHYARATGCDSVDGTKFSKFRDHWVPRGIDWMHDHLQQRMPA